MSDPVRTILASKKFPLVLAITGEEEYLVDQAATTLFEAARAEDASGMNCDVIDGENTSLDKIIAIARAFPMMSERRTVWVRRFDKVNVGRGGKTGVSVPLIQYLNDPSSSTFLLLTASTALDLGKKAPSKFPWNLLHEKGAILEYPVKREAQVLTWLREQCKDRKLQVDDQGVEMLVARVGTSLRELDMELDKLVAYLGDRTSATLEDIQAIVGAGREFTVFELQRAIGRKDMVTAMTIATRMMSTGRQEMLIITMLTRYFIALFKISELRGLSDRNAIAKAAGVFPFAVPEYLDAAQRFSPTQIERALQTLLRAEVSVKSSGMDAETIIQTMIARVAA
jgi:DNA polymerase-3 subunit delta